MNTRLRERGPSALARWWGRASPVRRGLILAALGAVAFSGKAILAKLMYRMGADAIAVVGLRMIMALPLFMWMAWRSGRVGAGPVARLSSAQWWQIAGLGFTGYYLASTLDFLGLQYITAGLERAILYLNPTLVLLLSALLYRRPVHLGQIAAMAIAYAGVALVWLHDWDAAQMVSEQAQAHGMDAAAAVTLGSLLVLGSALSYAFYLMGSGELVQKLGPLRLVGYASTVACVLCLVQWAVVAGVTQGRIGGTAHLPMGVYALSALNAVACTVLPVWLLMRGVQLLGASVAAQVGMVGPLSTLWMAAWFLDEPITPRLMLGTAAVLAGIVVLTRVNRGSTGVGPALRANDQAGSPGDTAKADRRKA